jgi:hypothetical protein
MNNLGEARCFGLEIEEKILAQNGLIDRNSRKPKPGKKSSKFSWRKFQKCRMCNPHY